MITIFKYAIGRYGMLDAVRVWQCFIPILIIYPIVLVYRKNMTKLKQDAERNWKALKNQADCGFKTKVFILLATYKPFRTVFYMRTAPLSLFVKWLLPGVTTFNMATQSSKIGGGLFIQHGTATGISAANVGENLWINQRASIGWTSKGNPTIGNNVTIGVGAVVLGPIKIGNNVKIGANAIVVEDVPDDVTVCSPKARIVKSN